jgi:hypothetical protein
MHLRNHHLRPDLEKYLVQTLTFLSRSFHDAERRKQTFHFRKPLAIRESMRHNTGSKLRVVRFQNPFSYLRPFD